MFLDAALEYSILQRRFTQQARDISCVIAQETIFYYILDYNITRKPYGRHSLLLRSELTKTIASRYLSFVELSIFVNVGHN